MKVESRSGILTNSVFETVGATFAKGEAAYQSASETPKGSNDFKNLQKQYPQAIFQSKDFSDLTELKNYAKQHLGSFLIVFSPEILKQMGEDKAVFQEYQELLEAARKELISQYQKLSQAGRQVLGAGIVINENGEFSHWIASQPKTAQQQVYGSIYSRPKGDQDAAVSRFQGGDGSTYTVKRKLSYRPAKDLARLAAAHNQQLVKTTMGGIRSTIYQLQSAGHSKEIAKQLIRQAEQVLLKARVKIKHLQKEELMELAGKRAEQQDQLQKAAFIRRQQREHMVKRKTREYSQIRDHFPTPQEIAREQEKAKEWVEQIVGDGVQLSQYLNAPADTGGLSVSFGGIDTGSGIYIDVSL